jgi:serine/threonine protein kinase
MNTTSTSSSTLDKSDKSSDYITLFDQKIIIASENIKLYSPLPSDLLWEIYEKIAVLYEMTLSPTIILKVLDKKTKKIYAVKQLKKERLKQSYLHEFAKNESTIHYSMGKISNLVVNVPHYFEDNESYFMVMEYSKLFGYFEELLEKV